MNTHRGLALVLLGVAIGVLPMLAGCERDPGDEAADAKEAQDRARIASQQLENAAAKPESDGGGGGGGGGSAHVDTTPVKIMVGVPDGNGVKPEAPAEVNWDFRVERSPKNAQWPKDSENNYLTLEGDFQFSLRLKDGKVVAQHVHQVNARRAGTLIEGIETTSPPQSTSDATKQAQQMLKALGFGKDARAKLDEWSAKAGKGAYENFETQVENSDGRIFTVRMVNDGTSELPWSVGLDIDWSKVCGCHG